MIYGSVCSGIEAASAAWEPLGWRPSFFSEIEPFPRAVLAHHFPAVPCHGDFTTIKENDYEPIQLLVGGTPCQDFSIAGLRKGITGDRGNLTLEFLRLAQRLRPRWVVWENVPGVLSDDGGRSFGAILGGLGECGYGFAYRILDAQYFGVPQRRRRVFVVGCLGDWRPAATVLFERESLSGNPPPRRKEGKNVAGYSAESSSGDCWPAQVAPTLGTSWGNSHPGSCNQDWTSQKGGHFVPHPFRMAAFGEYKDDGTASTLSTVHVPGVAIGWSEELTAHVGLAGTIQRGSGGRHDGVMTPSQAVRRLTPIECERLQGFPDDWTLVPFGKGMATDGHRYKSIGNSMAVPVMRKIGERIQLISDIMAGKS